MTILLDICGCSLGVIRHRRDNAGCTPGNLRGATNWFRRGTTGRPNWAIRLMRGITTTFFRNVHRTYRFRRIVLRIVRSEDVFFVAAGLPI